MPPSEPRRTLDGWGSIADYVATKTGAPFPTSAAIYAEGAFKLPVRRLGRRRRVFAYSDEIDDWIVFLGAATTLAGRYAASGPAPAQPEQLDKPRSQRSPRSHRH